MLSKEACSVVYTVRGLFESCRVLLHLLLLDVIKIALFSLVIWTVYAEVVHRLLLTYIRKWGVVCHWWCGCLEMCNCSGWDITTLDIGCISGCPWKHPYWSTPIRFWTPSFEGVEIEVISYDKYFFYDPCDNTMISKSTMHWFLLFHNNEHESFSIYLDSKWRPARLESIRWGVVGGAIKHRLLIFEISSQIFISFFCSFCSLPCFCYFHIVNSQS